MQDSMGKISKVFLILVYLSDSYGWQYLDRWGSLEEKNKLFGVDCPLT